MEVSSFPSLEISLLMDMNQKLLPCTGWYPSFNADVITERPRELAGGGVDVLHPW